MNTGLFGGTFNPVHYGHVRIATDIIDDFSMDSVIIVPAAIPPHKPKGFTADISLRLEMARLAFSGIPKCFVSDIEAKRGGRSYTIDTVDYFLKTRPPETTLFFIVGLDAFLELDTWKNYMKLIEIIPFIVVNRPLSDGSALASLSSFLSAKISDTYFFFSEPAVFVHDTLKPVYFHQIPGIDISSTQIRDRLKSGLPVKEMLPPAVEQFINERGLYQ